jgi:DNA-binding MarR family transcriptional regulator
LGGVYRLEWRLTISVTVIYISVTEIATMSKQPPALGQPPLTPAVFHILLALASGPLHGYAIMQAVEESAGPDVRMGPGTIYGSLQRMEEAGLVKEVSTPAGDRRRLFTLQTAGRRALEGEARRLSRLAALVRARRLVPGEA